MKAESFWTVPLRKHLLVGLVLLILALTTYHNAVHTSFMMDDDDIFGNPLIKKADHLKYFFLPDKNRYLGLNGGTGETFYRPLSLVLLMVLHLMFGDQPSLFSIFNIFFFASACFILYAFVLQLSRDYRLAFLTAVLFTVHPIHSLMVNYLTASVFTAMLICMVVSIMFFLKAQGERSFKAGFYALSLVFFVAAFLFHETAIGLPAFLFCILFFVEKDSFKQAIPKLVPFAAILAVYFLLRLKFASLKHSILDNFQYFHMSPFEYAASLVKIFYWYVAKLVYPVGIVLIWKTPVVREYVAVWILSILAAIAGFFFILKREGRGFAAMCWSWMLVGFAPVVLACLFQPSVGIMMEPHWVLFSSVGFFMLLGFYARRLLDGGRGVLGLVAIIMILWISISQMYNYLWADEVRYCRYWASLTPGFKTVDFYLANAYMKEGRYDPAREEFIRSLAGRTSDYQAFNNIGLIDFRQGRYDEAIENFRRGLRLNPSSTIIYNNLGVTYQKMSDFSRAKAAYEQALRINRFYTEPRLNLAEIALQEKDTERAKALYLENLNVAPNDGRSTFLLVELYLKKNDKTAADRLATGFIANSRDAAVLRDLGGILAQNRLFVTALDAYARSLRLDPNAKETYIELGKLMGNLDKFEEAIGLWNQALRLDPTDGQVPVLIREAMELEKGRANGR
jgi:tetratricopeptide (TPR) repeat protein